jgi:hypothetical protein
MPEFRISKNNTITSRPWTFRVYLFHCQQFGCALCSGYTFHHHQVPTPAAWTRTCRVYLLPPPALWSCRVYPFPQPAVWTRRVYPFHSQQYGRAGCILSTASSMDVQVVSFPQLAVWTCRVYPFHRQQYGRRTCRVYPSSMDNKWTCLLYPFPPPAVWRCRVYPLSPPQCEIGCIPVLSFSGQSCTGKKKMPAGNNPVPE